MCMYGVWGKVPLLARGRGLMSGGETPRRLWNYVRMGNPFNRLTSGGETPQWADVRRRNPLYELTSGRETPNGLASGRETPHYGLTSAGDTLSKE